MKKIILGEITDEINDTPINNFKYAIELSQQESFTVYTNNVQFLETLEVLCGEDNLNVYLKLNGECEEITCMDAYEYVGDIYSILNGIRFDRELQEDGTNKFVPKYNYINRLIKDYETKFKELVFL